ncbi:MAG: hypothetical protein ACRDNS_19910 [Trebonia sp.]
MQEDGRLDLAFAPSTRLPNAAAVCVLDTGLMSARPLLQASVDRALFAAPLDARAGRVYALRVLR